MYHVTLHLDNFSEIEWIECIMKYQIGVPWLQFILSKEHKEYLYLITTNTRYKTLCLTDPKMMGNVQNNGYI